MSQKFEIAIIGAGVAGLAAAIALTRQGHTVTVYERRLNTKEKSGSGVQIQPTGVQILKSWGLVDELAKIGHESGEVKIHRYDTGEIIGRQQRKGSRGQWYALRNDLRRFLYETAVASGAVIYFEKRAQSVDLETPSVTFMDGSIVKADLLIGADGTNSIVRKTLHPSSKTHVRDQCVFQALIPQETMYQHQDTRALYDDPSTHLWLGERTWALSSVAPTQKLYDVQVICLNFADADDPSNPAKLLESLSESTFVQEKIRGWNPTFKRLFENASSYFKWRIVEAPSISTAISTSGKVVLIGDAYHGMTPHAGEGSSIGIEDAAVLSELLSYASSPNSVPHFTKLYHEIRHERVKAIRRYSDFMGVMFSSPDGKKQEARDKKLRKYDPNKFPGSKADIKAPYGSAEWLTWLDVFDVGNTVQDALKEADQKSNTEKARL